MNSKASDVSEGVEQRLREEIAGWEQAYPLSAFPEPDLARAAVVLRAEGLTLDAISASNMRHVVSRLAPHIHEAVDEIERLKATLSPPLPSLEVERLRDALGEAVQALVAAGSKYSDQALDVAALRGSAALSALPLDGGL